MPRLTVATTSRFKFKFMEGPPARSMLVSCHLDWSPHKQRRSAVSIHFNVWMPVEVSSCEESPAPSPHMSRRANRATRVAFPKARGPPVIAPIVPVSTNYGCPAALTRDPEDDAQDD